MRNDKQEQAIRSSAAEYLTFVAATGDSTESMEMRYEDENIWLTQKMMSALYDVDVRTINEHIQKIYEDGELTEEATIRNFRIVQTEGSRQVSRQVKHYNLQMIIAVGFKVNNDRAVQFRKWANTIVKDYTIQGWAMDSDRLKNGGSVLTKEYFDHLLEQIREIRMSERKFYQKITDIYATALDYDKSAKTTRLFFSEVQNKLHWAIHRHTAAELIVERANAEKPHMGLTSWEQYPNGKIQKYDVSIAKNYLSREELQALERIVTMYLDYAEYQAGRHIPSEGEPRGRKQCRIKSGGRKASPARLTPPRNAGRGTVLRGSLFRGWDHTGGHHGWNGPSLRRLSGIITGIWTEKEAQKQSMGGIQL